MERVIETVEATIRRHGLLKPAGAAVLAVSGGPDSLALLHILREVCDRQYPGLTLHVGHLHHGMRGAAADADARFVESEARRLGLSCAVERADIPRLARERGIGIEESGRDARYGFLRRLAHEKKADRVLLGHQADDQIETVLMRVRRGAGPQGLAGIPYLRPFQDAPEIMVARPLLDCPRAWIEEFLHAHGLQSRLDATNLSMDYLRNRMRARFIPAMTLDWGPELGADVLRLARAARRLQTQAERMGGALLRQGMISIRPGYVQADTAWLRVLPRSVLPLLVQMGLREAKLAGRMLESKDYDQLALLVRRPSGAVSLPGDILAYQRQGMFILCSIGPEEARAYDVEVALPGRTPVELLHGMLETEVLPASPEIVQQRRETEDASEEFMDMDRLALPLHLRSPRPGDRMRPLGAPGSRKLQDIFTDLRVPRPLRWRIPVLTMDDRPIWVVGLRLSDEVKITPATKRVLRARWNLAVTTAGSVGSD